MYVRVRGLDRLRHRGERARLEDPWTALASWTLFRQWPLPGFQKARARGEVQLVPRDIISSSSSCAPEWLACLALRSILAEEGGESLADTDDDDDKARSTARSSSQIRRSRRRPRTYVSAPGAIAPPARIVVYVIEEDVAANHGGDSTVLPAICFWWNTHS
jgi:hypothetical protein